MEFYVDENNFSFFCKPYLLKLHFPHEVEDNELAKAVYDPNTDNGTIVVHLPKKEPGQDFPDLDMLTKLLQLQRPPVSVKADTNHKAPLIQVVESTGFEPVGSFQEEAERLNALIGDESNRNNAEKYAAPYAKQVQTDSSLLRLETSVPTKSARSVKLAAEKGSTSESIAVHVTDLAPSYGFNNAYSNFFRAWHGEVSEILSLPDPEHVEPNQRRVLREAAEEQQFDIERYLMDFANREDDMYFNLAMDYVPFWRKYPVLASFAETPKDNTQVSLSNPSTIEVNSAVNRAEDCIKNLSLDATSPQVCSASSVTFEDTEQEILLRLPRKEFLLPEGSLEEMLVIGGLVDILIGFTYEQLTFQGDSGVESTWTVSIVSPTLSWLDSNADLRAVVRSSVRRMITFPFLRQYDLAMRSAREASELLRRGKRVVLRSLLMLHRMVEKSETQYLLNFLYIQDYCVWIQSVSDERLRCVSIELDAHIAAFTKSETGWALEELERSLFEADNNNDVVVAPSSSSDSDSNSSEEESSREEKSTCNSENDGSDGKEVDTKVKVEAGRP